MKFKAYSNMKYFYIYDDMNEEYSFAFRLYSGGSEYPELNEMKLSLTKIQLLW